MLISIMPPPREYPGYISPEENAERVLPPSPPTAASSISHLRGVVAQSMDNDRLGFGIIHPPLGVELQQRRALTSTWRSVIGRLRGLKGKVATVVARGTCEYQHPDDADASNGDAS